MSKEIFFNGPDTPIVHDTKVKPPFRFNIRAGRELAAPLAKFVPDNGYYVVLKFADVEDENLIHPRNMRQVCQGGFDMDDFDMASFTYKCLDACDAAEDLMRLWEKQGRPKDGAVAGSA